MDNLKIIGITGGIGSGKSVVSRILRCNGFKVYDCDWHARFLMENSSAVKKEITAIIGKDAYEEDGKLNRKLLSDKIFTNPEIRNSVNKIVHKCVREDIKNSVKGDKGVCFIESAILFTSAIYKMCCGILLVEAPEEIKIKRVWQRNKMDAEAVKRVMESQKKEQEMALSYDCEIITNDGVVPLLCQLENYIKNYNIKNICYA